MSEIRKPPIGAIYRLHLPREPGKCDWCGLPCDERTPVRKQLRQTHYACSAEIQLITDPSVARWQLEKRDHGVCIDCGEDYSQRFKFQAGGRILPWTQELDRWMKAAPHGYGDGMWHYTEVIWVSLWHADHRVPLWKVAHMPPEQRIEYFKLANLVTRCEPCHNQKTAEEAAERAMLKRMVAKRDGTGTKRKSRKMARRQDFKWPKRPMRS